MVGRIRAGGICVRLGKMCKLEEGGAQQKGRDKKILKEVGGGASWLKGWLELPYELCTFEDRANQHENSHKLMQHTRNPVVNFMENQWK